MVLGHIPHPSHLHPLSSIDCLGHPGVHQIYLKEFNLRVVNAIGMCCVGVEGTTHFSNRCFSCASLVSRASLGSSYPEKCGLRRL